MRARPRLCRVAPAGRRQEVLRSSAVPTIWAKCFALTTQKFNKGRTKPNLSPNGDRSGYKFRSVQGRGQAFFGETSLNGTSPLWEAATQSQTYSWAGRDVMRDG